MLTALVVVATLVGAALAAAVLRPGLRHVVAWSFSTLHEVVSYLRKTAVGPRDATVVAERPLREQLIERQQSVVRQIAGPGRLVPRIVGALLALGVFVAAVVAESAFTARTLEALGFGAHLSVVATVVMVALAWLFIASLLSVLGVEDTIPVHPASPGLRVLLGVVFAGLAATVLYVQASLGFWRAGMLSEAPPPGISVSQGIDGSPTSSSAALELRARIEDAVEPAAPTPETSSPEHGRLTVIVVGLTVLTALGAAFAAWSMGTAALIGLLLLLLLARGLLAVAAFPLTLLTIGAYNVGQVAAGLVDVFALAGRSLRSLVGWPPVVDDLPYAWEHDEPGSSTAAGTGSNTEGVGAEASVDAQSADIRGGAEQADMDVQCDGAVAIPHPSSTSPPGRHRDVETIPDVELAGEGRTAAADHDGGDEPSSDPEVEAALWAGTF